MSNNLVFKLKSVTVADSPLTLQKLTTEAANEIERLRRAIETFINVYYNRYTTREIESLAIEELKQAVRGD